VCDKKRRIAVNINKIIALAAGLLVVNGVQAGDLPPLEPILTALMWVESKNDDNAIGDKHMANKAYGVLQIRQPCVDDVNRRYGTSYKAEQCLGNRKLSMWIFEKYISMYATSQRLGRKPTYEDIARIWNGGPNGHKKPTTDHYWEKTERALGQRASANSPKDIKPNQSSQKKEYKITPVPDRKDT
jgi:hypothetical protein